LQWSEGFAWIAWRLHVPASVDALSARAAAGALPLASRRRAVDALAFIDVPAASSAMLALAATEGPLRDTATWWVLNRMTNDWADHDLAPELRRRGIYDPDTVVLRSIDLLQASGTATAPTVRDVVTLSGSIERGREAFVGCMTCHALGGVGADVGPALDGWTRGKGAEVVASAIVEPDAGIAHGYAATRIRTRDGLVIHGLVIKEGDPLMVRSMGGVTQLIPAHRVDARARMSRSLMPNPAALGLTAQDVADVIAYLRTR
jgi:putative heme-binding domain-containing protein